MQPTLNHIAIIQTAFLGDAALALWLAEEIRTHYPGSHITFVCTPAAAQLVECAASVNTVIRFDKRGTDKGLAGIRRIASVLKESNAECVVGLQRSARTSVVARLSGAAVRAGFSNAALSMLYTTTCEWKTGVHEVERNSVLWAAVSGSVSAIPESVSLRMPPLPEEVRRAVVPHSTVVLAPGSVWATKRWLESSWIEAARLLRKQGWNVLLIGGREDSDLCSRIADSSGAISVAGMTSLPETLTLLQESSLLITNDSAPTHLAGLAGCRTLTLYGSTLPSFGFAPRGKHDGVLETHGLECRPCGLHGRNECPTGTFDCMTRITPDMVVSSAGQHIAY
ncbi:MAG: glycosyltransferase family 9 protein [Candidatus Kapabacteria bacterium]|nr:glycosyltransferase family 9 protein [Candidatus Kapabacteria bacterium]